MHVVQQLETRSEARALDKVADEFAGQIATAVWLQKLTDEAAREALWSYAMARHGTRREAARLLAVLTAEYRRRRERQDACG